MRIELESEAEMLAGVLLRVPGEDKEPTEYRSERVHRFCPCDDCKALRARDTFSIGAPKEVRTCDERLAALEGRWANLDLAHFNVKWDHRERMTELQDRIKVLGSALNEKRAERTPGKRTVWLDTDTHVRFYPERPTEPRNEGQDKPSHT